ncbi:MAG: DUF922 domain-containing protein [Erythrobacter sp.]|nr:DUF922 domain-containing protein [Erythrobacter sp.]
MRSYFALPLAIAIAFGLSAPAQAQSFSDYPKGRIDYYRVKGETPAEILSSIKRNSPGSIEPGDPAHATAFSTFNWTMRPNGRRCRINLTLELSVVFPRHTNARGLTGRASDWWNRYSKALEKHEAGHWRISSETYPVLLKALQSGPCSSATTRGMAVLDDLRDRQEEYDRITNHGEIDISSVGL